MAATSAGKPLSGASPTLSPSPNPKPSTFSPDFPPPLIISSDQLRHCTDALKAFQEKLQMPQQIRNEFFILQANRMSPSEMKSRCSVALDSVNCSKNRYGDVLPCM
ncbi:hypothetical protein CsSME_00034853 [Camellia sinensis var. sinensis]